MHRYYSLSILDFLEVFKPMVGLLAFLFTLAIVSVCQVMPGEFPVDRGA